MHSPGFDESLDGMKEAAETEKWTTTKKCRTSYDLNGIWRGHPRIWYVGVYKCPMVLWNTGLGVHVGAQAN